MCTHCLERRDKNGCCCDKIMHMMQNSRRGKCAPHVWKGVTRRGPKSIVIAPRLGCLPPFLHEVTTNKVLCAQFANLLTMIV